MPVCGPGTGALTGGVHLSRVDGRILVGDDNRIRVSGDALEHAAKLLAEKVGGGGHRLVELLAGLLGLGPHFFGRHNVCDSLAEVPTCSKETFECLPNACIRVRLILRMCSLGRVVCLIPVLDHLAETAEVCGHVVPGLFRRRSGVSRCGFCRRRGRCHT